MATYVDILRNEFPEIDSELFDYITGVLDSGGADFEDGEEVYDAIGGVLQEVSTVDAKKLEKAEAKLKAKHERRNEKDSQKASAPLVLEEASASQASSKKDNRVDQSGKNRSYDIRIENFDVSFGERCLLQGAELTLASGRRYGLIGRNGLGKTTLLKMLASRNLRVPAHISILHVEQEVAGDETSALQSVLQSDTLREDLLNEEKRLNARIANGTADGMESVRLSEIYGKLEEIEADKAPARASVILAGLGFSPKMQQQATKEFSGGWRMRLALARALFARSTVCISEPTNMLDVRAILWLENYLQTWQSTILVVSHDRNFLNAVVTDIIHLHSQRLDSYRGDYENFIKTKEDRLKNQQREYEAQLQYRQHIQVFIDRFRYNANRAAQVQSKLKLLEKLPELKPIEKETEVTLRFPDNFEKLSPPILQLDEVEFYYTPDQRLFSGLNLSADLESRICIVGENGAGKTTVLKLLMGELTPISGVRQAHRNLKIGYFSQHHVDQLDLNVCSVELLLNKFPGRTEEEYRHQLGGYGITGELAMRPVASLSGGQKSRVAFAQMTMPCPNFYILDEPTNHLDMETIEALAKALNKFRGGVTLVSHDERLIRMVCKELWVCEGGQVQRVDGGFDEYRDILQEQFRKEGYL
uniref:ATP-binding cassette sub-family F member 3 n=1 Tax=Mastacembelus armatus TaxID=205130 RepID=A0A3Q3MJY6_9TELE